MITREQIIAEIVKAAQRLLDSADAAANDCNTSAMDDHIIYLTHCLEQFRAHPTAATPASEGTIPFDAEDVRMALGIRFILQNPGHPNRALTLALAEDWLSRLLLAANYQPRNGYTNADIDGAMYSQGFTGTPGTGRFG